MVDIKKIANEKTLHKRTNDTVINNYVGHLILPTKMRKAHTA